MSFTLKTALLLISLGWISISASEFQTVDVRFGEEATLLCSNFTSTVTQIFWFGQVNRLKPCCISSMYSSDTAASFCTGFDNGKFETTSNMSTVFLKIKHADVSDSGLYFCGFYLNKYSVIVSATYLNVQEESSETTALVSVILSGVTLVLTKVIAGLVVKMRLHTESGLSP